GMEILTILTILTVDLIWAVWLSGCQAGPGVPAGQICAQQESRIGTPNAGIDPFLGGDSGLSWNQVPFTGNPSRRFIKTPRPPTAHISLGLIHTEFHKHKVLLRFQRMLPSDGPCALTRQCRARTEGPESPAPLAGESEAIMQPRADRGWYWWLWWLSRYPLCLLRFAWVLINNMYCIPVHFFYLGLASPLLLIRPALYWRMERIFYEWLLCMVSCWTGSAGYRVLESGDRLDDLGDQAFVFMPNHQSTADVPLCMTLFAARPKFCQHVMWIMDKVFKFTNFGWVAWMHCDFFILAGKAHRDRSLVELKSHLTEAFVQQDRRYLVLFPEGGFLRKRKQVSQAFAKKNDLPHLNHCTLPRTGALEVVLDVLGPNSSQKSANNGVNLVPRDGEPPCRCLTKLVDVTIAYPDGMPLDLLNIAFGNRPACTTHVHYRVFDVHDIPLDPDGRKTWMYQVYADKERLLSTFYQTGVFPYDLVNPQGQPPKELVHDGRRFLFLHTFYITSTYFMLIWVLIPLYYMCI
ncbi:hypothetical protein TCAL_00288, partial [Tigriopus californicus]